MKRPWLKEPDHVEFRYKGFPCIIHRGPVSALCGYVGVPPGHPWHGKGYDSVAADVHGGLTYASECQGDICHRPEPGESDDVWWLGFDCAHYDDLSPKFLEYEDKLPGFPKSDRSGKTYRTVAYVRKEIRRLVDQAMEAA